MLGGEVKGVCRQELDQVQAQEANLLELFPARQWKDAIHFEHKPRSSLFMISVMTKWFKKIKCLSSDATQNNKN